MTGIIYIHRNKINGKCYVGQTTISPHKRWGENGCNYIEKYKDGKFIQPKFANAILKHGWDNFEHLLLSDIYTNQEELDAAEIATIAKYNSYIDGYNATLGGGALNKDKVTSEEIKCKIGTEVLVKNSSSVATTTMRPQHQQPQLEQQPQAKTRGRRTIQVLVIDTVTDEEKLYDSIEAFATENNLNLSACRSAKQSGYLLKKRYYIE